MFFNGYLFVRFFDNHLSLNRKDADVILLLAKMFAGNGFSIMNYTFSYESVTITKHAKWGFEVTLSLNA